MKFCFWVSNLSLQVIGMGKEEEESPKKNAWTFESGSPGWAGFLGSVTSSKTFFFFFCHSAQDLSSWTRDQTLGLAGNRLPGNSQARQIPLLLFCKSQFPHL